MLTERQIKILNLIIDMYVKTGEPVSSNNLIKLFDLSISSATIRNEMVCLEKEGYIEKYYASSGRIPTNKSYEYYIKHKTKHSQLYLDLRKKITELFENRQQNIEETISLSMALISDATNSLTISKQDFSSYLLEDIKIYKVNENIATIMIVTSCGKIFHKEVSFNIYSFNDLKICIDIMNERLKGTRLNNIIEKSNLLVNIIGSKIKASEFNFEQFISKIFDEMFKSTPKSKGIGNLVKLDNIDPDLINKIMNLIENNSIWSMLENSSSKKIRLNKGEIILDLPSISKSSNLSAITRNMNINGELKNITLLGPKNQIYNELLDIFDYIEEQANKDN